MYIKNNTKCCVLRILTLKKNHHRPSHQPPSKIVRSLSIRHNFIFAKKTYIKSAFFFVFAENKEGWDFGEVLRECLKLGKLGISGREYNNKKTDQYEDVCVSWFKGGRNIYHECCLWFGIAVCHMLG